MVVRWIASIAALMMVGVVGVFLVALFRPPPEISAGKVNRTDLERRWIDRVVGRAGLWTVTAEIDQLASGPVTISLSFSDDDGQPRDPGESPRALLRMIEMEMGAQPVPLERLAPGRWRGRSNLSMDGRWSLEVQIDEGNASLPFEARSR